VGIIGSALGQILKAMYGLTQNYGLSIILFVIIVKTIILPLTVKQTKSSMAMQEIQPRIKEIQEKYKNKPEKQNEELQKLYKETKFNPLSGCLPLLIQMPIIFFLFWVLKDPVKYGVFETKAAYDVANTSFLWIKSLSKPDYIIAFLSGISAYFMQKVTMATTATEDMNPQMKSMTYIMTGMSFIFGFQWQSGLVLYWTVSNVYSIIQTLLVVAPMKKRLSNNSKTGGEVGADAKKSKNKLQK
jgi:YidC/Oxa1 family membrane protein insertase